ncbi:MAG: NUDIX hydrolase [Myxococcota bacterium]|nr:coenzyme A pyrophosphatase [Spirochaeta sp.]RPG13741.1 MAG: CoA pyrophosphatase [Proteobacteria bacterium TMED72]
MPENPLTLDEDLRRRMLANLEQFDRRPQAEDELSPAAVAFVITQDQNANAAFIITRRSSRLQNHAGQWALPGGRRDPGETAIQTALRETEEEIGITLAPEQVLGLLDDYTTRSGFVITPVVIWAEADLVMKPNEDEVESVYLVPLQELELPDVPTLKKIPESDRLVISVPLPTLNTQINAPTAAILYQFREVAMRGLDTRVSHYDQAVFAWR